MDPSTKLRYQGCLATPPLWRGTTVSPFPQIELPPPSTLPDDSVTFKQQRLGKLVEEFIFYQLQKTNTVTWVCDNLQIQNEKQTVGEIDALYYDNGIPVHLEVAYKFYLYDTLENQHRQLSHWIGPNRKDRLAYKLDKLHRKQFPLLRSELASSYLQHYQVDPTALKQALCFKAQLFLPYRRENIDVSPLSKDCIAGTYLTYSEMNTFSSCDFFIPKKLDWLVIPHPDVSWIEYAKAREIIKAVIENHRSPLVWIRHNNGEIIKCFIVFW